MDLLDLQNEIVDSPDDQLDYQVVVELDDGTYDQIKQLRYDHNERRVIIELGEEDE